MSHALFQVSTRDFKAQVLESKLPVLIEFTADWCPPCKMLTPIIHELADQYEGKLRVGTVDNDTNMDVVLQYGVMGLPTMILFVDGAPVERIVGFTPKHKIEAKLLPHLALENA